MSSLVARCCYLEHVPKLEEDDELRDYSLWFFHYWKKIKMMTSNSATHRHYWAPTLKLKEHDELMFVVLLHNYKKTKIKKDDNK